jgi:sorting nexin-8
MDWVWVISPWHELHVVLHNRENTLLTQLVQSFAHEEQDYMEAVAAIAHR